MHHDDNAGHRDEINLLDYYKVINHHKKMIAGIVMAASVVAVVVSLLMTKSYKAEAVIIPVSSSGGGGAISALAGDLGGFAKLAGVKMPSGAVGDADKLMAILKSRSIVENVINRKNLMPILFEKSWDAAAGKWKSNDPKKIPNMEIAVRKMKGAVKVSYEKKEKTITITGTYRTPELAASFVNYYIEELQNFINANALTTAKRNRLFIEGQLAENKADLLEAGKEINAFYHGGRVSSSEAQVDVPITTRNPEQVVSSPGAGSLVPGSELDTLISQKADIEKKIAEVRVVEDVPQQVYLTYLMLRRELLAKVNALLTSQYEMAKIEESKEELSFQVIDRAVPPVMKASPKRSQICIMSFMAALFGAVFLAFFRDYLGRMKKLHQNRAEA
ncbi:MAG: Wzz/FepE/Etk N-terminal domain-containing protein [bacterium]